MYQAYFGWGFDMKLLLFRKRSGGARAAWFQFLFVALERQLGLRLIRSRAVDRLLVVDKFNPVPTENRYRAKRASAAAQL